MALLILQSQCDVITYVGKYRVQSLPFSLNPRSALQEKKEENYDLTRKIALRTFRMFEKYAVTVRTADESIIISFFLNRTLSRVYAMFIYVLIAFTTRFFFMQQIERNEKPPVFSKNTDIFRQNLNNPRLFYFIITI